VAEKRRRRAPARAHALALGGRHRHWLPVARWLPSGRSLAVGFALLAAGGGAYAIARETSIFAVRRIEVEGAPPALAAQIRTALAPLDGKSLVSFSRSDADRRLAGLPQIARVSFDRDFPHTLRVRVTVEQPVAVLRKATDAWLISASGRVLAVLQPGSYPPLPRIWLAAETDVTVGATVATGYAVRVADALREAHFPGRVLSVRDDGGGQLVLQLQSGREVRLGDMSNMAVKLAVAAAVLPRSEGAAYVDVSVPTRAVAGYPTAAPGLATTVPATPGNTQVSGQG
jgi:cell division protein FtsQ